MTADAIQLIRDNHPEINFYKFQFEEPRESIMGEFLIPEDTALLHSNQYLIIENRNAARFKETGDSSYLTVIHGDELKAMIPENKNP